jgi:acyl-CoA reductase-like NAD-dependent aldehyde dehydrogenase
LAQAIADKASKLKVGNAILADTECGPLVNPNEVKRVEHWVNEAVAAGAQVLCGGQRLGDTSYSPTVLLNPPRDAKVSTQEVFGPVVCVYGTESLTDAIAQANCLPVAFQAAVFTQKLKVAMRCVREIDATAVMVNDHTAFRVDWMPFAGRRQSGYGVGGIGHTMHDMTQEKMAVIKL